MEVKELQPNAWAVFGENERVEVLRLSTGEVLCSWCRKDCKHSHLVEVEIQRAELARRRAERPPVRRGPPRAPTVAPRVAHRPGRRPPAPALVRYPLRMLPEMKAQIAAAAAEMMMPTESALILLAVSTFLEERRARLGLVSTATLGRPARSAPPRRLEGAEIGPADSGPLFHGRERRRPR